MISDLYCNPDGSTDQGETDAMLGPLADNGLAATPALLPGSPAIDAARSDACPATDQRGAAQPFGEGCDVGAVEGITPRR